MMTGVGLGNIVTVKFTESIFGVFYVLSEGGAGRDFAAEGHWMFFFTVAMLIVDAFQVLRSMVVSKYMWTAYSISIMRSVDLVQLFLHTVYDVIPEYAFFCLAILLALATIVSAAFVMKLFRAGQVKIIWPLRILRSMIYTIVTVFFTTALELMIYPARCIDPHKHLSEVMHGEGSECEAWALPEIAISIPALIVAFVFVVFSLVATFFGLTINPLCRHPLAMCTGRVESLWTLFKVGALLLVYMEAYISAMACAIILFLLSVFIFYHHCSVLPFHNRIVNMVRGGIYLSMVAFTLANIVIQSYPNRQALQFWFLGSLPVAFLIGGLVVWKICASISRYIGVLRGQWDERILLEQSSNYRGNKARRNSVVSEATQMGGQMNERSMHEQFFDVKWALKRRFPSGAIAHMATRIVLERRNEEEMPFLMSLLNQCLKDHPNSFALSMAHLLILRYVFKERSQATTQEKLSKLQSSTSAVDSKYVLFAVNKKTVQEGASDSLAKGAVSSAINMMEFDQRIEIAHKAHRECIVSLKAFWKYVAKRRHNSKSHGAGERAAKMTEELERFTKAMHQAMMEYAWLYQKYPSSAQLLHSYANFCDHVLNDSKKADSLRAQVACMDTYEGEELDGAEGNDGKGPAEVEQPEPGKEVLSGNDTANARQNEDQKSVSRSSDSETFRSQMNRYMLSFNHLIMQRDSDMLRGVNLRIRCAIFFLVTLSLISFIVIDFILFNDVALKTIRDIEETGKFRELAATAPYMLRSQMVESQRLSESLDLGELQNHNIHLAEYDNIKTHLIEVTRDMQRDHYITFSKITTKKIQEFYDDPSLEINIPNAGGWEVVKQSFRHLGTDFARRVASAASASYTEHRNTNYRLKEISQEKQDISYVFENMIRYVLPAFDQAVVIYQRQMDDFGVLSTMLTSGAAALTSVVVLIIAIDVLRARVELLKRVNSNRLAIELALELPHTVSAKFYKYFSDLELDMAIMEDEDQEVRERLAAEEEVKAERAANSMRGRSMSMESADFLPFTKDSLFDPNTKPRSTSVPISMNRLPSDESASSPDFEECEIVGSDFRLTAAPADGAPSLTEDNLQRLMRNQGRKGNRRQSSPPPPIRGLNVKGGNGKKNKKELPVVITQAAQDEAEDDSEEDSSSSDSDDSSDGIDFSHRKGLEDMAKHLVEEKKNQVKAKTLKKKQKKLKAAGIKDEKESKKQKTKTKKELKKQAAKAESDDDEDTEDEPTESKMKHEAKKLKAKNKKALKKKAAKAESEDDDDDDESEQLGSKSDTIEPERTQSAEKIKRDKMLAVESEKSADADEVADAERPEEDSSLTPVAKEKSLRFSSSAKGLPVAQETEPRKPKVFGGLMRFMGAGKGGQSDAKDKKKETQVVVKKEKTDNEGENKDEDENKAEKHPLDLNTVDQGMHDALVSIQFAAQPWFNRWYVYLFTLAVLLVLCMMFSLYPARRIPIITNMAPSVNRAAERQSLARGCITLSRELVLGDGLSRMTHGEISGTLDFFINKFEDVDNAVRLGDIEYDIVYGADHRSKEHNDFMYMLGCPWREDPTDCSLPNNTYTRAAEDGLFNLQSVFLTSLKTVLRKYGSSPEEYINTYDLHRDNLEDASEFNEIDMNQDVYDTLLSDPDLRFLDLMFAGDMHKGLDHVVDLFEIETRALLDDVHVEVRLLFGIYIGFLLQVFYSALFMRTLNAARLEVFKAKEYAHTLPLHVLDGDLAATVKRFYMRNNGQDEPDQHLAEDD